MVLKDFCDVWKFIYSQKAGVCSHQALSLIFQDTAEEIKPYSYRPVTGCNCSTCIQANEYEDVSKECSSILRALSFLETTNTEVTMNQLTMFLLQNSTKWNREHAALFKGSPEFGAALNWKKVSKEYCLDIIRICIFHEYISLNYCFIKIGNSLRAIRRIVITDSGSQFVKDVRAPWLSTAMA